MMKNRRIAHLVGAALSIGAMALLSPAAYAQQDGPGPVTLDLRDAPIRAALEQIFNSANVQYTIDNAVQGFVTLKIRDQPFVNALKLIMRSATIPLTYTVENNVYIVKPRVITPPSSVSAPAPEPEETTRSANFERVELTYLDPLDLAQALGINVLIRYFNRGGGGGGFGGGGLGGGGFGGGGFGGGGLGGGGFGGGGLGGGGFGGGGLGGGGFGGGGFGGGGLGGGGFGGGGLGGGGFGGGGFGGGGFGGGGFGGGRGF